MTKSIRNDYERWMNGRALKWAGTQINRILRGHDAGAYPWEQEDAHGRLLHDLHYEVAIAALLKEALRGISHTDERWECIRNQVREAGLNALVPADSPARRPIVQIFFDDGAFLRETSYWLRIRENQTAFCWDSIHRAVLLVTGSPVTGVTLRPVLDAVCARLAHCFATRGMSALRETFPPPMMRPEPIDPQIFMWNDGLIPRMLINNYPIECRPGILADALEEAGCHQQCILDHLRSRHVRHRALECWVWRYLAQQILSLPEADFLYPTGSSQS